MINRTSLVAQWIRIHLLMQGIWVWFQAWGDSTCCFCSVTQSYQTLRDPMDCSTPCFSVLHHLPEFVQTHVHWVGDAIQPSHPLLTPSSPALNLSQHQEFFPMSWLFASGGQSIGASASASVLPKNIQGWFPLGLTGLLSLLSKGLSRVFSSTTNWKHHSSKLSLLYGPTLTTVHDYWKNHCFDYVDLCWQSDVSAF